MAFEAPAPDLERLVAVWDEWERGEQTPGKVLASFGKPHQDVSKTGPTHIFNLGHGISQFTPPEHVAALVEAVHSQSRALRR